MSGNRTQYNTRKNNSGVHYAHCLPANWFTESRFAVWKSNRSQEQTEFPDHLFAILHQYAEFMRPVAQHTYLQLQG